MACSEQTVDRIEACLQELVERQGRRAAIVGQSRGGSFARVLARRRPDLVAGIVTLGTAHNSPLAVHPLVTLNIIAVGAQAPARARLVLPLVPLRRLLCGVSGKRLRRRSPGSGFVSVYQQRWRRRLARLPPTAL